MKALSQRQPWGSAVVFDDRRIENRNWQQLRRGLAGISKMIKEGERFCIHASSTSIPKFKKMDVDLVTATVSRQMTPEQMGLAGAIIGTAVIAGVLRTTDIKKKPLEVRRGWNVHQLDPQDRDRFLYDLKLKDLPLGGKVGYGEGIDNRHDQINRWWLGPYALVLDEVRPLAKPVPVAGRLYFWEVPPVVEEQVKEQIG